MSEDFPSSVPLPDLHENLVGTRGGEMWARTFEGCINTFLVEGDALIAMFVRNTSPRRIPLGREVFWTEHGRRVATLSDVDCATAKLAGKVLATDGVATGDLCWITLLDEDILASVLKGRGK